MQWWSDSVLDESSHRVWEQTASFSDDGVCKSHLRGQSMGHSMGLHEFRGLCSIHSTRKNNKHTLIQSPVAEGVVGSSSLLTPGCGVAENLAKS